MNEQKIYLSVLQTDYEEYCKYVHAGQWKPSRFHSFLCETIQNFIESETGHSYDILVVSTPPQHGKLLWDETPVLTRNGWKKHGELVVGDEVISPEGKFVKVTHVHPKYYADRKVTITNGEEFLCHHKHEWVVHDRRFHRTRTLETCCMEGRVSNGAKKVRGHRYTFMLPAKTPLDCEDKELNVHPYVLGAWLGDGTNTKQCICASPKDDIVLKECAKHYEVSSANVHKDTGVITWYYKGLNTDLRTYGLCNATRTPKRIPEEYLTASYRQRMELLAGLIDTDGHVDHKHNRAVFTTAEESLRDSFIQLVSTFGWRTTSVRTEPSLSSSGIQGRKPYWQIAFNPTAEIPCRIERKQIKRFSKQRRLSICNIEKIEPVRGNCITVEGGVYCVGHTMIPTHNSVTITETLPSWFLGRNPDKRVIEVSYNETFAEKFGRKNKSKLELFGDAIFGVSLGDKQTSTEFEIRDHRGGMISRGILSGVTGSSGDLIIIDDPIKNREEADSANHRDKIWEEWLNSIKTRVQSETKIIVIQTRWHEDDLVGRILENETNVTYINIPLEAEKDDILGRREGEALCPEIGKGDEWLADFKKGYMTREGSRAWYALMQGRPTTLEGNLINRDWWQYYDVLPECPNYIMSVDAAFKDKETNDYVVIQVWAKRDANMYLVDMVRKHIDFPTTLREIVRLKGMYPVKQILVEDKANGSAIIQVLRKQIHGVIGINPLGGKVSRVNAIAGAIESGNVYLPHKPFTQVFVDECSQFPNGSHDDMVDAMSQALNRFIYHSGKVEKTVEKVMLPFNIYKKDRKLDIGDKISVI